MDSRHGGGTRITVLVSIPQPTRSGLGTMELFYKEYLD
jgi:hypothetical protein